MESGVFPIRNGVIADKTWKEDLILKRYSWYHEYNLQFEVLMGSIAPQSGFNFWFSKDELESFNKCTDARVVMIYSIDTKTIPLSTFYSQLELNGFSRFELIEFKKNLMQHPDSVMNSLKLYHIFGICRKTKELSPVKISLPGFMEKTLI
jgi:hypothetical protein